MKITIDCFVLYCGAFFVFIFGFVFGAVFRSGKEKKYFSIEKEWIDAEKYCKKAKPCDGAVRCPQAEDVTCEECGYPRKPMTMAEKEALVYPTCQIASAYNCAKCQEEGNRA